MLHGRHLYTDLWDLKPPAIYWMYAAVQAIAGLGPQTFFGVAILGSGLLLIALYFAGSALTSFTNTRNAGLLAAAAYAIIGGSLPLQGNEPNAELFMNVFLAAAFAFLLRSINAVTLRRAAWLGLLCGGAIAFASLYKTVAVAHAICFGAALLLLVANATLRRRLTLLGAMGIGAIVPWLLLLIGYWTSGQLRPFYRDVFLYNSYYATMSGHGLFSNLLYGYSLRNLFPGALKAAYPLLALTLAWTSVAVRSPQLRASAFAILLFALATYIAVALPGQYAPHYYQLWLPIACIGAAWCIAQLQHRYSNYARHIAVVAFGGLIGIEMANYFLSSEDWTIIMYGRDPLIERKVGAQLRDVVPTNQPIYQWGSVTMLYYAAQRRPSSGIFFIQPMLAGPLVYESNERVLQDLAVSPPALLVLDTRDVPPMPDSPVVRYFNEHYNADPDLLADRFRLLRPKDAVTTSTAPD
jgi:hypothetical protein